VKRYIRNSATTRNELSEKLNNAKAIKILDTTYHINDVFAETFDNSVRHIVMTIFGGLLGMLTGTIIGIILVGFVAWVMSGGDEYAEKAAAKIFNGTSL
jgi:hypothetical protein